MADLTAFPQIHDNNGAPSAFLSTNNYKTQPTSNFGTRSLEFFRVEVAGLEVDFALSNSVFTKAIKGVQTIAQVAIIGEPAAGAVVVAVEGDTNPDSGPAFSTDATPTKAERMAAAVGSAVGVAATVTQLHLVGGALA